MSGSGGWPHEAHFEASVRAALCYPASMQLTPIQWFILAQVAAATGCNTPTPDGPTPIPTADTVVPVSTSTAADVTPTASVAATVATAVPTNTPAPTTTAAPQGSVPEQTLRGDVGAQCGNNSQCRRHLLCDIGVGKDGKKVGGTCVRRPTRGRPLVVDGQVRTAARRGDRWNRHDVDDPVAALTVEQRCEIARQLRADAFEEHASIAAFARTICELCALGAPADLIAKTQRALADEIRHTETCLAWAQRLDGVAAGPGALPAAVASFDPEVASHLLVDVFRGGCVGETLAAHELAERAEQMLIAPLADALDEMANDEARHAALAFETVMWLAQQSDELADLLQAEIERFDRDAVAAQRALVGPLLTVAAAA